MRAEKPNLNAAYFLDDYLGAFGFQAIGTHVRIHRSVVIPDPTKIKIGSHVRIDAGAVLTAEHIDIGSYVHIGSHTSIVGQSPVIIGHFCGISHGARIFSSTDDLAQGTLTNPVAPQDKVKVYTERVHMESHAIIGANSVVMPGVRFGKGAYLGAMSLAKDDIPDWTIAAGVPAANLKPRNHKHVEKYEKEVMGRVSV